MVAVAECQITLSNWIQTLSIYDMLDKISDEDQTFDSFSNCCVDSEPAILPDGDSVSVSHSDVEVPLRTRKQKHLKRRSNPVSTTLKLSHRRNGTGRINDGRHLNSSISTGFISKDKTISYVASSDRLDSEAFSKFKADDDFLRNGLDKEERINLKYIDTHCHLDLLLSRRKCEGDFVALKKHYASSWSPHYGGCIADFCFPNNFNNFELWEKLSVSEDVWLAIGCHPHYADVYNEVLEQTIKDHIINGGNKVVAVGELGLDYSSNNNVDHDVQKETLRKQLKLAVDLNKPILLHCRDAAEDCFKVFEEVVPGDHRIHWHCYTDNVMMANKWIKQFKNIKFGVTLGIYSPRKEQEEFWKSCELDRLLIETDSPYFLPHQYRSVEFGAMKQCHPGLGALVAWKLAEIRKVDVRIILDVTLNNTKALYGIQI